MRISKSLLVGVIAASLGGCGTPGSGPPAADPSPGFPASTRLVAAQDGQVGPGMHASARVAAARFRHMYHASRFATSWDLLAPAVKREIPRGVWVRVHEGCPSVVPRKAVIIKSVTIFGRTAIVTETLAAAGRRQHAAEELFTYVNGHWRYLPGEPGIYHHGSVAADIAAARAAGLCASWKSF